MSRPQDDRNQEATVYLVSKTLPPIHQELTIYFRETLMSGARMLWFGN
jgi:hypothetical protein